MKGFSKIAAVLLSTVMLFSMASIFSASAATTATLTGSSMPSTITRGSNFNLSGTITASAKITHIYVFLIYNPYYSGGEGCIAEASVNNTTTYNLSNLSKASFSTLPTGVYYLRFKVDTVGDSVFIDHKFSVDGSTSFSDLRGAYSKGDLNGDCVVNDTDYELVRKIVLNTYEPSNLEIYAADVNWDGEVNAKDYMIIKRHALGDYYIIP